MKFAFAMAWFVWLGIAEGQESTASADVQPAPVEIIKDRVETGFRAFQVVNDGVVDGRIEVFSAFVDGDYVIHDHSHSAGLGVDEDLFLRLDGETFSPRSVAVSGDFSGTHVMSSFVFEDDTATGAIQFHRAADGRHQSKAAEVLLPAGFFLRGSALYLVNAMKGIEPGGQVTLNWFNSLNGQLSTISLVVEGVETIEVPAGSFRCLVVRQSGGQPGNLIYITIDDRRIVRFDVIGQPMQLELLPVESSAADG